MRVSPSTPLLVLTAGLVLSVVLLLAIAVTTPSGRAAGAGIDPALLADLTDGGEVLLVRHALTDRSQTDTARAIDPAAATSDALLSLTAVRGPDAIERLTREGSDLIAAQLGGDDLAVLVSHTQNIEALTGWLVDEGDAVVLDASGVVGVIAAEDW